VEHSCRQNPRDQDLLVEATRFLRPRTGLQEQMSALHSNAGWVSHSSWRHNFEGVPIGNGLGHPSGAESS
jgi:hypothetical protein